MSFTCSGPKPSVADLIRDKFARDGEVPLSFLKTLLPQENEMALMELATDLNADHRGTVEQSSHYAPLAKDLRQKSPFLARFKRLAESATQWCLLSSCKEEKSNALTGLGKEEWNPGDDLSTSEAQEFIQTGFALLKENFSSAHSLIPVLIKVAEGYQINKSFAEDIEFYEKILELDPANEYSLRGLAKIYRRQVNPEKEIAILVRITKQKEVRPQDFADLALASIGTQKYKEAAEAWEEVIKREPGNSNHYRQLANAYFLVGEKDKQLSVLQKATALFPNDSDIQWRLGVHFETEDKAKKTAGHCGQFYMALHLFSEAADAFIKAGDQAFPVYLIEALRGAGRLNETLKKAESLLQKNPSDEGILFQYALIQQGRGDLIAATVALKKIVDEVNPSASKKTFETLEKIYRLRGMNREADTIHQRWMEKMLQVQK